MLLKWKQTGEMSSFLASYYYLLSKSVHWIFIVYVFHENTNDETSFSSSSSSRRVVQNSIILATSDSSLTKYFPHNMIMKSRSYYIMGAEFNSGQSNLETFENFNLYIGSIEVSCLPKTNKGMLTLFMRHSWL